MTNKIKTIDVHELKTRMDQQDDLCLIDVRELDEWQALRIPGAVHIPKDTISQAILSQTTNKTDPVYLHCKGGVRSMYAAQYLMDMGYQDVYSINGGIMEWAKCGYPTIQHTCP